MCGRWRGAWARAGWRVWDLGNGTIMDDHVAKVVQSRMANYFQIFSALVFSYRLFIFTNRGNFQVRTWVLRKFAAEKRVNFQRGDWTRVKWSSQSRKRNFLTLPDLAFGFVHKRSGNEIRIEIIFWDHVQFQPDEKIRSPDLFFEMYFKICDVIKKEMNWIHILRPCWVSTRQKDSKSRSVFF